MPWLKIDATRHHAQLELPDKDGLNKELVGCLWEVSPYLHIKSSSWLKDALKMPFFVGYPRIKVKT